MAALSDPGVREVLDGPNYAIVSTINPNGSIHNTVVWIDTDGETVAVNSGVGRLWPSNLERDPRIGILVYAGAFHFVEIRGTAAGALDDADDHAERLAHKYTGKPFAGRRPGEQRIKFTVTPEHVRYVNR
jgi:PPOX class probable F420-dependent enzyme